MNVKISGGSSGIYANQDTCTGLVTYLQHEDLDRLKAGHPLELFFDQTRDDIRGQEVIKRIDSNRAQLGKNDAKFYSVIFSPSVRELQHLSEGSQAERSRKLKAYIREEAMQEYAAGFSKGLKADDILYFGKIHYERGEKTEDQLHIHLIVSRKDITNKKKLSPMTNHRGTEKGAVKGGFNRERFVAGVESRFDQSTGYDRDVQDSFAYYQAMKNGDMETIKEFALLRVQQENKRNQKASQKPVQEIKQQAGQEIKLDRRRKSVTDSLPGNLLRRSLH
jgi:diadenosine tetraphosphate (Ap4A) HIT family hydrolase